MAHITSFDVSGLAGREQNYGVSLDSHINIFFGTNGSGKTSLLRLLHAAMFEETAGILSIPFLAAEVEIFSTTLNIKLKKSIDTKAARLMVEGSPERRPEERLSIYTEIEKSLKWKLDGDKSAYPLSHSYLPTTRLYAGLERGVGRTPETALFTDDALEWRFAARLQQIWTQYFAKAVQGVNKVQEDGLASILRVVLASHSFHSSERPEVDSVKAYQRVTAFLRRRGSRDVLGTEEEFKERYKSDKVFRDVVSDINNVEQQIDEVMQPRTKLQNLIDKLITGRKKISLGDSGINVKTFDDKSLALASLSSGEKQVLRILIEALIAGSNSIIIDEPELSMHIDWQRELIPAITALNPDCQLILATHSPEIMVGIDDSKIHRL